MKRYFIYLSYNGANYCGWQRQPNSPTVQQTVEDALATLLRTPTPIVGAGRTDTGVHARMMVAHLDSDHIPPDGLESMAARLNSILPKDVAINRILPVNPSAHARFDAISRTYHYYAGTHKDPFNNDRAYILHGATPDFDAMNLSCRHLADYTDFTSFSKLHSGAKTNNCRIHHAEWTREGDLWRFTITADRFLRNMVRAIVGTLFDIGRGKLPPDALRDVIEARDRAKAGNSAPPHALFLDNIAYPEDLFLDV